MDVTLKASADTRKRYQAQQMVLGKIRAKDFDELAIKLAASMAYEGGFLDEGFLEGNHSRHHLRFGGHIVALSVALDAVMLAAHSHESGEGIDVVRAARQGLPHLI